MICGERGGSCALRERARASDSQGQRKGVSERPPIKGYNDVAVDRFDQACRFLASLGFPLALRGYLGEEIADEARTPHLE